MGFYQPILANRKIFDETKVYDLPYWETKIAGETNPQEIFTQVATANRVFDTLVAAPLCDLRNYRNTVYMCFTSLPPVLSYRILAVTGARSTEFKTAFNPDATARFWRDIADQQELELAADTA